MKLIYAALLLVPGRVRHALEVTTQQVGCLRARSRDTHGPLPWVLRGKLQLAVLLRGFVAHEVVLLLQLRPAVDKLLCSAVLILGESVVQEGIIQVESKVSLLAMVHRTCLTHAVAPCDQPGVQVVAARDVP